MELIFEFALVPVVDGENCGCAGMRGSRLGLEHSDFSVGRTGTEGLDGSLRAGGREHEQIAGLVEGEIHGIEGIVADDGEAFGF